MPSMAQTACEKYNNGDSAPAAFRLMKCNVCHVYFSWKHHCHATKQTEWFHVVRSIHRLDHPSIAPHAPSSRKRVDVSPWNFIMDLENANVIRNPFGLQARMWLQHLDSKVQQWSRHLLNDAYNEWPPTYKCTNFMCKSRVECMMTEQILPAVN